MQQVDINFTNDKELYDDDWVSRSAKKRKSHHLRDIGIRIIKLSQPEFDRIPFNDDTSFREACEIARHMKPQSEELRRQILHVESVFRTISDNSKRYEDALDVIASKMTAGNAAFHQFEELRDSLIKNGMPELNKLTGNHPELNRQKLRTLILKAQKENDSSEHGRYYKELFKYIRDTMENI